MNRNQEIIKKIVRVEWDMFTSINEGKSRASCQDDRVTFEGMRAAQFNAWSPGACESYLGDLEAALGDGRNLVEEKYIHMMKTTAQRQYDALLPRVTAPSDQARALAHEISDILLEQTRVLFEGYPYVAGHGRPLNSISDCDAVSFETYQLSELLTYSGKTLSELKDHILALEKNGVCLARNILENTVGFFGYRSLDAAEKATRERIEKKATSESHE